MNHYYPNVTGLGNVALSRHAQDEAEKDGVSDLDVQRALFNPDRDDIEESGGVVWREANLVRLVIITPTPFRGAKLVKTLYRVQPQKVAKK